MSHRSGARFGPRAIREAQYTAGSIHSLQLGVEPFEVLTVVDAGDANIVPRWIERAHALIYRKVREVAATGAIPIVLGGDHSITWPSATAVADVRRPGSIGIVHFDAHADTANEDWGVLAGHGTPMRRLIESGAVAGRNFVQVGLRGYWPPVEVFEWMKEQRPALPLHDARSRSAASEAVIDDAIAEALDGPDSIYLSLDIDVIDPGLAPGTGTPEPGGMLTREVLRAVRQIVGAVELAGMDIVEVSPPYDHRRDDRDGGQPRRARGDQRARRQEGRRALRPVRRLTAPRSDRTMPATATRSTRTTRGDRPAGTHAGRGRGPRPAVRPRPRPRTRATSTCTSRWPSGPAARSSSSPSGTGRLAVPLAAPGHERHRRRHRSGDARPGARPGGGDRRRRRAPASSSSSAMPGRCGCPMRGRYRLAFIALNSLFIMGSRADQQAGRRDPRRAPRPGRPRRRRRAGCPTRTTSPATTAGSCSSTSARDPATGQHA